MLLPSVSVLPLICFGMAVGSDASFRGRQLVHDAQDEEHAEQKVAGESQRQVLREGFQSKHGTCEPDCAGEADRCDGCKDGVSGCRDCCCSNDFHDPCVRSCMDYGFNTIEPF